MSLFLQKILDNLAKIIDFIKWLFTFKECIFVSELNDYVCIYHIGRIFLVLLLTIFFSIDYYIFVNGGEASLLLQAFPKGIAAFGNWVLDFSKNVSTAIEAFRK